MSRNQIEHQIQCRIVEYSRMWPDGDVRRLLYAVPNGGARSIVTAARLKNEGVLAGVPDLCLPVPRGGFGALFIEVKTEKGRIAPEQERIQSMLHNAGNCVRVVRSAQAGIDEIERYLALPKFNARVLMQLANHSSEYVVEIVPGHQSTCFASERQEKRGLK